MSDFVHDQVHLTQFVAPLQADFNPSLHDTAKIFVYNTSKILKIINNTTINRLYIDLVERFTVQWDQVHNHDHVSGKYSQSHDIM